MSNIFRAHLITDEAITGIDERMDRLISLQLHHHGELAIPETGKTEKHCYTAIYEPQLNFISNDYREMDIVYQSILWPMGIGEMAEYTILGMNRIFEKILTSHKNFHVFLSYLSADADTSDGKVFFNAMLKNKSVYKCGTSKAQKLFIKLLDFTGPGFFPFSDGRDFYASEDESTIFEYKWIHPFNDLYEFSDLPVINGKVNIHNILFQVERD
ncbi:MAG: hypothetical protein FWF81_13280 [Defluviitaleaceae bacterium]|nr:hypothetical protein [Defluviitaleaceae bacterium]